MEMKASISLEEAANRLSYEMSGCFNPFKIISCDIEYDIDENPVGFIFNLEIGER